MGAVLHLVWKNILPSVDGTFRDFKLDVDFICPMVPIGSGPMHYNDTEGRREFLTMNKPVGWLDELLKVTETENISPNIVKFEDRFKYKEELDCRLKLIHPKNAISINSMPYLREEFISGDRKRIYLALKILKEATGAKITSYQLKTDLLKVFRRQPENMKIGEAVLEVFKKEINFKINKDEKYHQVGDLFQGVNSNLVMKGFSGIDLSRLDEDFVILKKKEDQC